MEREGYEELAYQRRITKEHQKVSRMTWEHKEQNPVPPEHHAAQQPTLSEFLEAVVATESFLEAAESFRRQIGSEVLRSSRKAASDGRLTWRASMADWDEAKVWHVNEQDTCKTVAGTEDLRGGRLTGEEE